MNDEEAKKFIDEIQEISKTDPVLALYNLHQTIGKYKMNKNTVVFRDMEMDLTKDILANKNLPTTNLDAGNIIKELQTLYIDYYFMIMYQQLKKLDIKNHAPKFQFFFDIAQEDKQMIVTLIYDLLHNQKIDFDYKFKNKTINPNKLKNIEANKDLKKLEENIKQTYEKNPSEGKIAIQVFSKYITTHWVDIVFDKAISDTSTIQNVTDCLLGKKQKEQLNTQELELLSKFN